MNKFLTLLIVPLSLLTLGSFAHIAWADSSITFNPDPLFTASNFVPGSQVLGHITAENDDPAARGVYIEAINVSDTDALAAQMKIELFNQAAEIYEGSFQTFLDDGPVLLSSIAPGVSATYDIKITFLDTAGNEYQGKHLSFDLCAGFSNGSEQCIGDAATSTEPPPVVSSGDGGGNSGGSTSSFSSSGGIALPIGGNSNSAVPNSAAQSSVVQSRAPDQVTMQKTFQAILTSNALSTGGTTTSLLVASAAAAPPLFDVISEPVGAPGQSLLPFLCFILLLIFLIILLALLIRKIRDYYIERSRLKEKRKIRQKHVSRGGI